MQDTQLATDIVIGILGEYNNRQHCRRRRSGIDAAADRSVARCICGTPGDATKYFRKGPPGCDPGAHSGGAEAVRCLDHTRGRFVLSIISNDPCASLTHPHPSPRVNYHRTTCTSIWVDGTPSGVRQNKSSVGNLRGCNTPFASCVKSEERRTGAFGRRLGYDHEERLGITSNVIIITAAALLLGATKIQY